jgi:PEGA domain
MRSLLWAWVFCGVAAAAPKPKLAALILRSGGVDEELADNLTEVLISRLARRGDHEIAGKEEFKTKLGVDDKAAGECMQNLGCLGRAGTELGVTRVVVGTLGRRGADYLYNLNLIDISTGHVENRVFELVAGGGKVDTLIAAVQATADKLLEPKVEPGGLRVSSETRGAMVYLDDAFMGSTPVRRDGIEPGAHHLRVEKEGHRGWTKDIDVPAGNMLEVKVPLTALPEKRKWPGPLSSVCFAVGAGAAVVGIVLVALSTDAPLDSGVTRRQAVESADRRYLENRAGWGMLGIGAGLGITAAALAIAYRRDMFGGEGKVRAFVAPARSGVMAGVGMSW